MKLAIRRLPHAEGIDLPRYETAGAAGMDLRAATGDDIVLAPGERMIVPTGLVMAIPPGFEGQVRPRSGLAAKHGVTLVNSPGTIDCDYRGEVGIILINLGQAPFTLKRGERIAQLLIAPVLQAEIVEAETLDDTARGAGGFGSTGTGAAIVSAPRNSQTSR